MKMPRNCWDCPVRNTEPCPCKGYSTALEHTTDRHQACPLVPVPDHGRLIDESDVLNALEPVHREEKAAIAWKHIYANEKYLLSKVPTILPADFAKDTNVPTKTADKEAGE